MLHYSRLRARLRWHISQTETIEEMRFQKLCDEITIKNCATCPCSGSPLNRWRKTAIIKFIIAMMVEPDLCQPISLIKEAAGSHRRCVTWGVCAGTVDSRDVLVWSLHKTEENGIVLPAGLVKGRRRNDPIVETLFIRSEGNRRGWHHLSKDAASQISQP